MIPNRTHGGERWGPLLGLLGLNRLYRQLSTARGVILQFHGIAPRVEGGFAPYAHLDIEEGLFAAIIGHLKRQGVVFVGLDEIPERLAAKNAKERFCAVTFDHGYRSIVRTALPILHRNKVPHTIFVAANMVEAMSDFWWISLERLVGHRDTLVVPMREGGRLLDCANLAQKNAAMKRLVDFLITEIDEDAREQWVDDLCDTYGMDRRSSAVSPFMEWPVLKKLARDPLCSIGSQGIAHHALARIGSDERIIFEMEASIATIEAAIGERPRHFAFPFGDAWAAGRQEFNLARDAGFATAVTTRQGALYAGHTQHLTALPRISINGNVSSFSRIAPMLNGLPPRLSGGLRKLNVD